MTLPYTLVSSYPWFSFPQLLLLIDGDQRANIDLAVVEFLDRI